MFTKDQSKFKRVIECSHILGKSLPEIRWDLKISKMRLCIFHIMGKSRRAQWWEFFVPASPYALITPHCTCLFIQLTFFSVVGVERESPCINFIRSPNHRFTVPVIESLFNKLTLNKQGRDERPLLLLVPRKRSILLKVIFFSVDAQSEAIGWWDGDRNSLCLEGFLLWKEAQGGAPWATARIPG